LRGPWGSWEALGVVLGVVLLGDGAWGCFGDFRGLLENSWGGFGGTWGETRTSSGTNSKCTKSTPNKSEIHRRTGDVGDVCSTFVGLPKSTMRPPWLGGNIQKRRESANVYEIPPPQKCKSVRRRRRPRRML
jgi:hypothetical protein